MFVVELQFECFADTTISAAEKAINQLFDALRFNGQILGREFSITLSDAVFSSRLLCPEKDSLHPKHHSAFVLHCLNGLSEVGLLSPKVKCLGQDINAETTADDRSPSWQILYTTYVHTCSPIRSGDDMQPIPLYRYKPLFNGDGKALIKWQSDWQACDELQMSGSCQAEFAALHEMGSIDSHLFKQGMRLRERLEAQTLVPTYYYQYQLGGRTLKEEKARLCPVCQGHWLLAEPIHDIFHFKCDTCHIVSNISWDLLK